MNDKYLTVTALTRYLKRKMDTDPHLRNVWLRGEISNFKQHSRGHMYMTIKDDQARMQSVMFAGNNRTLKFRPENGMNVLIKGEISVYEAHGQYQLYIQHMEPDGIGALYLAYEQLKEKLSKQGYFNSEYKKTLPLFPERIGIITSPTGAAVRDIITTIKRRYPIAALTVIPVLVQGPNAAKSVVEAINIANNRHSFDVLIVGRGGGSIEELWCFNEEIVAEAIFKSEIPIISAVGHETDNTISDFVADVRAPTPTAAGEIAVQSQVELQESIRKNHRILQRELERLLLTYQNRLKQLRQSYAFKYPEQLVKQKEQALDTAVESLTKALSYQFKSLQERYKNLHNRIALQHPEEKIDRAGARLAEIRKRQNISMSQILHKKTIQWNSLVDKLTLLSPLETMKRGFALPYDAKGRLIKSITDVEKKDFIELTLSDGKLSCQVQDIEEENNVR
ncbi:exodeoxyribonuclease VII large subunit [Oceanobacillus manasiensis]|uniref:exodeoxyribonuclease VII large subunit n=1 Tax=Oceanobacillus manasiensis TaxID=586413 RepID=UPI0005A74500|nr:exodeoxyribonuclease VII large subunit [Oceanobacillus manasiensis]